MEVRSIPWGQLHYEYWLMAITAKPYGRNQLNQPFRGSKRENAGPRGSKGGNKVQESLSASVMALTEPASTLTSHVHTSTSAFSADPREGPGG